MPWGKVDDNHYDHPKVLSIPRAIRNAADGLYWRAISRCNRTLSDGWLTDGDLDVIDSDPKLVEALVSAGLWERKTDGRLRIHDYLVHNKSKAEVLKERRTKAEAGRSGGLASGRARAKQTGNGKRSRDEAPASPIVEPPSRPVPTRPDPSGSIEPDALTERPPVTTDPDDEVTTLQKLAESLTGTPYGFPRHGGMGEKVALQVRKHGLAAVDREWRRIAADEGGMPTVRQLVLGSDNVLNRITAPVAATPSDKKAEVAEYVARMNREAAEAARVS
jgi:hypothetical protein